MMMKKMKTEWLCAAKRKGRNKKKRKIPLPHLENFPIHRILGLQQRKRKKNRREGRWMGDISDRVKKN